MILHKKTILKDRTKKERPARKMAIRKSIKDPFISEEYTLTQYNNYRHAIGGTNKMVEYLGVPIGTYLRWVHQNFIPIHAWEKLQALDAFFLAKLPGSMKRNNEKTLEDIIKSSQDYFKSVNAIHKKLRIVAREIAIQENKPKFTYLNASNKILHDLYQDGHLTIAIEKLVKFHEQMKRIDDEVIW